MFYKEILQLSRNRVTLWTIVGLQLVDILAMGFIDTRLRDMPLVIVDQDHTAGSRELIQRLEATRTFRTKYITSSIEQARGHLRAGRARVAIVVPPDYGRLRSSGQSAHLLTLVDGSDATTSAQAVASIDGLAAEMLVESADEMVASAEVHVNALFNPMSSASWFMLPGLLALVLSRGFLGSASSLLEEREDGYLERVMMSPVSHAGLVLGTIAPHAIVAIANGLFYLGMMHFAFDIPIRGSVTWLMFALVAYVWTLLTFGAFISATARTSADALTRFSALGVLSVLLTGYILPLSAVPKAMLPLSYAMPETHFIVIMRGICLRGTSAKDLAVHLVFLAVAPLLFTVLAARRFSKTMVGG